MIRKNLRLDVDNFPRGAKTAASTEYFSVKTAVNNLSFNRVGVLISTKVNPSAVKRNALKRIIMDYFRGMSDFTKPGRGTDILIILKPKSGSLPKEEFYSILKKYVSTV